jgi:hypothetical protein
MLLTSLSRNPTAASSRRCASDAAHRASFRAHCFPPPVRGRQLSRGGGYSVAVVPADVRFGGTRFEDQVGARHGQPQILGQVKVAGGRVSEPPAHCAARRVKRRGGQNCGGSTPEPLQVGEHVAVRTEYHAGDSGSGLGCAPVQSGRKKEIPLGGDARRHPRASSSAMTALRRPSQRFGSCSGISSSSACHRPGWPPK